LDTVTEHPKCDSLVVVVLVGQILHETGFVFGTCQAFINTNFLMRGVVIPEYLFAWSTRGWYLAHGSYSGSPGTGNTLLLTRREKRSKWKRRYMVNIFPNHGVAWEWRVDQYDAMVGFLMMAVFRIQARNPFISCTVHPVL
jgi:hypothetical protein